MRHKSSAPEGPDILMLEWYERGARNGLKPGQFRIVPVIARYISLDAIELSYDGRSRRISLKDPSRRYLPITSLESVERATKSLNAGTAELDGSELRSMLLPVAEVVTDKRPKAVTLQPELSLELATLLSVGENSRVEFKESLLWALTDQRPNMPKDEGERVAILELAAFANAEGGRLVFGVRDDLSVCGIGTDLDVLALRRVHPSSTDDWELRLRSKAAAIAGAAFSALFSVRFLREPPGVVAVVSVNASPTPVFVRVGNMVDFPVRIGNEMRKLNVEEAIGHYANHFS